MKNPALCTSLIRVLAHSGMAPRRDLAALISESRVSVDGVICRNMGQPIDAVNQLVAIDGKPLPKAPVRAYFLLNKPRGFLCTNAGVSKRVVDIFEAEDLRLFTVGRLDKDTTGLIFVTNDGDFCQRIAHPSNQISKEYLVKVNKEVEDHHLRAISQGTMVEGVWVKPLRVTKVRRGSLKVVVCDGRKHEVKHLMAAAGLEVYELSRIRIGGLVMGSLPVGGYRALGEREIEAIFH